MSIWRIHLAKNLLLRLSIGTLVGILRTLHMPSIDSLWWASTILLIRAGPHARVLAHAGVVWWAHLLLWLLLLWLWRLLLSLHCSGGRSTSLLAPSTFCVAATAFLAGYYVNEKVEHVAFRERGGNVAALQGAAFIIFRMYPSTHR